MKKDRNEALMYVLTFNPNGYGHAAMVASYIKDDHTAVVGALHDVVEDGATTFEKVQEKFDLDEDQITALRLLTRNNENKSYAEYIDSLKGNKIAVAVKMADLKDNIRRCAEDLPKRFSLLKRYMKAYEELSKVKFD